MSVSAAAPVPLATEPPVKPVSSRSRSRFGFAALALLAAVVGGYLWLHRGLESTDDAQIDGDVVAVPSRLGGVVSAVHFSDNQQVMAGALLVELDPAPARARLAEAEAELLAARALADAEDASARLTEQSASAGRDVAKASLSGASIAVKATSAQITEARASVTAARSARDQARHDLERAQALAEKGAVPQAELDSAETRFASAEASLAQAEARVTSLEATTYQARAKVSEASARLGQADTVAVQVAEARARAASARARVATAEAQRDLAALDLSYTKIFAPRAGVVSKRSVSVGQMVSPGQATVMVVPRDSLWVTANFKETQLAGMRIGQPATIDVDAFGRTLHGKVESFSGATGARFALLPPDNATGNFTKVVQRVPVRVRLDDAPADLPLLPGMSVDLTVDTRGR